MRIPLPSPSAHGRTYIDLNHELTEAILLTVEAGWEIARNRAEVAADAEEVALSECLRDGMRDALRRHILPWGDTMVVLPGAESRSRPHMTAPDGRTDIPLFVLPVFQASGEHDPHAIIECKRVAEGNATLTREYVVHGIDRFKAGKYAGNHARGFMIGYVISGRDTAVVDQVNSYLTARGRQPERLSVSGRRRWTSMHARSSSHTPIALHHTMLAVN